MGVSANILCYSVTSISIPPIQNKKEKTRERCMRVEEPKRRIKEEIVTGEENSKF